MGPRLREDDGDTTGTAQIRIGLKEIQTPIMTKFSAIIPAAGSGRRMGHAQNKLLLKLNDETILEATLKAIKACPLVAEIILALKPDDRPEIEPIAQKYGARLVEGGATRQDSVYNALLAATCDYVMIHDGARPLVTPELVTQVAEEAIRSDAAILAIPVKDTIKEGKDHTITKTVPRETLWAAQTPQAFRRALLVEAYEKVRRDGFVGTDEASLLEYLGHPVRLVTGSDLNLKVTTPADLKIARAVYACGIPLAQVDSMEW